MEYSDPLSTAMGTFMQAYGLMSQNKRAKEAGKRQDAESQALQQYREKQLEQEAAKQGNEDLYKQAELQGKYGKKINNGLIEDIPGWKPREDPYTAILHSLQVTKAQQDIAENKNKANEAAKGKTLPASEAVNIGSANSSIQSLNDLRELSKQNEDITGPGQGLLTGLQSTFQVGETGKRGAAYDAAIRSRLQSIGTYLERGKLTDKDVPKYEKMMPTKTDTPEVVEAKLSSLERMIAQRQAEDKSSLGQAGYNVGEIKTSPVEGFVMPKKAAGLIGDQGGLKVGEIKKGHKYIGGDPANKDSWEKVK